jgi:cytochrome c oxidase accessory protein FixG
MNPSVHERLATVDKMGRRLWVYADIIVGEWRERRRYLASFLIVLYLSVPWFRFHGHPLIQFDFNGQKLIFFGSVLGFNETSVLLAMVLGFGFAIIGLTSIAGRVWCGWGCPQTIFLDFIFRPIEKWCEGRPLERKKRDLEPLNFTKLRIKTTKWILYGLVSFLIANTFVAYFVGRGPLIQMMMESPFENPALFGIMLFVFASFLFNFGWFREQMCTLVCPYGRLQSVLLDKNSYIVGYDTLRGEPRGKGKTGACVDCNRCVQVCPTGIDIRNGLQLECINCSACIDACNLVMSKIGREPNLIKYTTETLLEKRKMKPVRYLRPSLYFALSLTLMSFGVYGAFFKAPFEVMSLKEQAPVIFQDANVVRNQLGFLIRNHTSEPLSVSVSSEAYAQIIIGQNPIPLPAGKGVEVQLFLELPANKLQNGISRQKLVFQTGQNSQSIDAIILGHEVKK